MKLRMLQSVGMTEGSLAKGDIVDADDVTAKEWTSNGFAEPAAKSDEPLYGVTPAGVKSIHRHREEKAAKAAAEKAAEEAAKEAARKDAERVAAEKAAAEKAAKEQEAADKAEAERKAAEEKAAKDAAEKDAAGDKKGSGKK